MLGIRHQQPWCIFPHNNLTLKQLNSCISYQLWIQTPQAQEYRLTGQVTPLPHCWHVLRSWPVTQNLSSRTHRLATRKPLLTQWRALDHSTGIWLHYGSRLLWIGSGWDSLWAEAGGLCGPSRYYTHITCCQQCATLEKNSECKQTLDRLLYARPRN